MALCYTEFYSRERRNIPADYFMIKHLEMCYGCLFAKYLIKANEDFKHLNSHHSLTVQHTQ